MNITSLEIGLHNMCNVKCLYCFRQSTAAGMLNNIEIEYNALIRFLDFLPDLTRVELVGALSEPTLYYRFKDLIIYLKNRNIAIKLSTNGSTFDEEWWADISQYFNKDDSILFPIEDIFEDSPKYRKYLNCNKMLKNMIALKTGNVNVNVVGQLILFEYVKSNKEKYSKFCKQHGFKIKHIPCFYYKRQLFDRDLEQLESDSLLKIYERYLTNRRPIKRQHCETFIQGHLYINEYGELLPCCKINDEKLLTHESFIGINEPDKAIKHALTAACNREICTIFCNPQNNIFKKVGVEP